MQAQLSLWGGAPVPAGAGGGGPILRYYQRAAVEGIQRQLETHRSTLLVLPTGGGKCLGRGTLVMRHDGALVAVEDVRDGDLLMGPDGTPRAVLSTCAGEGPLFRIVPRKGEPWVCNDVHVLTLVNTTTGDVIDIGLDEYLAKAPSWKHLYKLFRAPAEFPRAGAELPLTPYFVGLLLGDGSWSNGSISVCKPDAEVEAAVRVEAQRWGMRVRTDRSRPTAPSHYVVGGEAHHPWRQILKDLDLHGKKSHERRIPRPYLLADRASRLELLAGMIDSDGALGNNIFDWISCSRGLADDIAFLARSLGLAAYVNECRKGCQTGAVGTYFRVSISGDIDAVPTRIPRKQAHPRRQKKDVLRTGFTVEPIGRGEYFGFTLEGDGRFLLGDFTVTHNTVVLSAWAARQRGRGLFLAHRSELLEQMRATLEKVIGEPVDLDQAELRAGRRARLVVGSVQTLWRDQRLDRHREHPFDFIVCDEAHHGTAVTYRKIFDAFPGAKLLGVTATPDRGDGIAMRTVFESVAFEYQINAAIEDGFLAPVVLQSAFIKEIKLAHVKSRAGDLSADELDEAMAEAIAPIARVALDSTGDRRTVIFCPGVRTAHGVADALNEARPGCAQAIDGSMDPDRRRFILQGHKRGAFQYLANCAILTEGYDDPGASCVIMARPTKSRALYTQCMGRGLRILPGVVDHLPEEEQADERRALIAASGKPDALLIDIAGNAGKHDLASALVILGGRFPEEVRKRAKKKLEEGGVQMSVDQALEVAEKELRAERERKAARRTAKAAVEGKVLYELIKHDPFAAFGSKRKGLATNGDPPTPGQLRRLAVEGIPADQVATKAEAARLIGTAESRRRAGLCNFKQVRWLASIGIDNPHRMYEATGRAIADAYKAHGKLVPPRHVIDQIIGAAKKG